MAASFPNSWQGENAQLTHACGAVALSPCSANMARKTLRVVSPGQYSSRTDCDRACNLANLASSPAQLCALCRQRQRQHHLQVTARCPTPAQTSPLNLMISLRLLDAHAPANLWPPCCRCQSVDGKSALCLGLVEQDLRGRRAALNRLEGRGKKILKS